MLRKRELKVDRINKLSESDNIFVLGDMAFMQSPKYTHAHPLLANVAINQAKNLASNLTMIIQGEKTKEYEYKVLGTMATLGRNKAVVD